MTVTEKEIAAVSLLPRDERLRHFVKRVADFEEVWAIQDDGWVLAGTKGEAEVFQVWPFAEYASLCCVGEWAGCVPAAIPLDEFMDSFLPDFEEKGILIGIFYTPNDNGVLIPAQGLVSLLEEEIEKY